MKLGSIGMTTSDTRIALCVWKNGELSFLIVDHPGQPADYVHADGTVWTWHERWHLVGGVREADQIVDRDRLRAYDLVTSEDR
jgi:hypothetical protein